MMWQHQGVEEATWEREDTVCANYPFLFDGEGVCFLVINVLNDCRICLCLIVCMCV